MTRYKNIRLKLIAFFRQMFLNLFLATISVRYFYSRNLLAFVRFALNIRFCNIGRIKQNIILSNLSANFWNYITYTYVRKSENFLQFTVTTLAGNKFPKKQNKTRLQILFFKFWPFFRCFVVHLFWKNLYYSTDFDQNVFTMQRTFNTAG